MTGRTEYHEDRWTKITSNWNPATMSTKRKVYRKQVLAQLTTENMVKELFPNSLLLWLTGHNGVAPLRFFVSFAPLRHVHAHCWSVCCSFVFFVSLLNLSLAPSREVQGQRPASFIKCVKKRCTGNKEDQSRDGKTTSTPYNQSDPTMVSFAEL